MTQWLNLDRTFPSPRVWMVKLRFKGSSSECGRLLPHSTAPILRTRCLIVTWAKNRCPNEIRLSFRINSRIQNRSKLFFSLDQGLSVQKSGKTNIAALNEILVTLSEFGITRLAPRTVPWEGSEEKRAFGGPWHSWCWRPAERCVERALSERPRSEGSELGVWKSVLAEFLGGT